MAICTYVNMYMEKHMFQHKSNTLNFQWFIINKYLSRKKSENSTITKDKTENIGVETDWNLIDFQEKVNKKQVRKG